MNVCHTNTIKLLAFNNRENSILNQNGEFNVIPMDVWPRLLTKGKSSTSTQSFLIAKESHDIIQT